MGKERKRGLLVGLFCAVAVLFLVGWFLAALFEGEKAWIKFEPKEDYLSEEQEFSLSVGDKGRGLRKLTVFVEQEGRQVTVVEEEFPHKGFLNREGVFEFTKEFSIDPSALKLSQGRVDIKILVRDYSKRKGGDGNLSMAEHKMVVDTIPPSVITMSRLHYVNKGGTGLVVYETSSDTIESGVFVGDIFFSGYPAEEAEKPGVNVCYFAVPHDAKGTPEIYLWGKDRAGNETRSGFYCHVRERGFSQRQINISDSFLQSILPYFSPYLKDSSGSNIEKFLKINRELRRENASTFSDLRDETVSERLWQGRWLRLENAATMAKFGDRRSYYYKGQKIDQQVHLGVDLASLSNSKVQAANSGRVIFAERLGIYGLTVVLDHGQGLASTYSHLSGIKVEKGREVEKGEVIGITGQTGLAGGDHLHFGVMVGGVFVSPVEWWDSHWIEDNVERKLALLDKGQPEQ